MASSFQLGSTLLHKYRIDRFRRRKDGVLVYEGVDTTRSRRVCVKILEPNASIDDVKCARFHDEAHRANVIDIGTCDGLPYFVTSEGEPLKPPQSKKPPPLPKSPSSKSPSSKPPPLPKPKPPPLPAIPVFLDDDAILDAARPQSPPIPPPISSEQLLAIALETQPRERRRGPWALLFAAIAAATGWVGWYVGQAQSAIAPANAAAEPDPTPTQAPEAATPAAPSETVSPPRAIESATPAPPASSSKARPRPTVDPLTL